jgi:hypothetical protein
MNSIIFPEIITNSSLPKDDSTLIKNQPKNIENNNKFEPFKAFSSALFMSEYQEKEDTLFSSNSNSDSNKGQKNINMLDLNISPSLEKCLTNELLESLADDSSIIKLKKNSANDENENELGNELKITKKLFEQNTINKMDEKKQEKKEQNGISLYEDNNNGFEYQLKFIENSIHNILPKSYKKSNNFYNNNNYSYKKSNHRSSFPFYNKYKNNNYNHYKNPNDKYYGSNNKPSASNLFYPDLINKNNNENQINYSCDDNVKNQIIYQIQKAKANENSYEDWKCNNCSFLNRGYRKICSNCNIYRRK